MISPKFVFIAREVLKFIRNGGKLGYAYLCKDGHCCPLGAVCVNNGYKLIMLKISLIMNGMILPLKRQN